MHRGGGYQVFVMRDLRKDLRLEERREFQDTRGKTRLRLRDKAGSKNKMPDFIWQRSTGHGKETHQRDQGKRDKMKRSR